ncbi:hypothetical protein L6452_25458 [Arctium lappa]|uniref:Uncharacterized protein n=1 Tax=Arctium lappa TaxID=4217 RepID=A0ACB9ABF3_ARCLA|nr:hypothetical protein L6452_25458 [Arctium lappa]
MSIQRYNTSPTASCRCYLQVVLDSLLPTAENAAYRCCLLLDNVVGCWTTLVVERQDLASSSFLTSVFAG